MKHLFTLLFFLLPGFSFAMPQFPMSFYGNVTINGNPAPVNTTIRAYHGDTLTGEVKVESVGIYGENDPFKQQLLVGEGSTTTIRFTAQVQELNGGVEIPLSLVYPFSSGEIVHSDLSFVFSVAQPPLPQGGGSAPIPSTGVSSGASAGGGGGAVSSVILGCLDKTATNYSPIATASNNACVYSEAVSPSVQSIPVSVFTPVSTKKNFIFARNLSSGLSGDDVSELQERLAREGFYSGPVTGYFGNLTASAVRKYQAAKGLDMVGSVGPKTRALLNEAGVPEVLGASTYASSELTPEVRATLIKQIIALIAELQRQIDDLRARQPS